MTNVEKRPMLPPQEWGEPEREHIRAFGDLSGFSLAFHFLFDQVRRWKGKRGCRLCGGKG